MAPLPFDLRLEQSDDRTVAWRTETFPPHNRGEPSGFSKLATPMLAGAMRRANRKDLGRLQDILEGRS